MQRNVVPEIRDQGEDIRHVVTDVLLDDPDKDGQLLQMENLDSGN